MQQLFVDREAELSFLERKYSDPGPQLLVIYGRRRFGKTVLIKKFLEGRQGVYLMCTKDSMRDNVNELKRRVASMLGKEYLASVEARSIGDALSVLAKEAGGRRLIVALDEFPYLIDLDPGVTSNIQRAWDEDLSRTGTFLILCGSSVGMMEREVLGARSPLYGRRTGAWEVVPFQPEDLPKMFPLATPEDAIKIWAVFGGTPFYLSQADPSASVEENIRRKILAKGEVLYGEPLILLREEFREPAVYLQVLKHISLGYVSLGDLSGVTGLDRGNLSKYLSVLESVKIVRHTLPLGQRKRGHYIIEDPFFCFWFRFVYPNISDLELGLADEVMERIEQRLSHHYGEMFHRVILHLIRKGTVPLPFRLSDVGVWWHKGVEIDVVGKGESGQLLFCECKWEDRVDPWGLVGTLREKAD
ncbi:MAG: ATP-binding protein, partial [Candidatus Methanomethylicia archaeon]|nr:ATP-binding protein [Candidatus Methanomethylicia archaeon]